MITRFLAWLFRSPRLDGRWNQLQGDAVAIHMANAGPKSALHS